MVNSIHSEAYCKQRIKEIRLKNKGRKEMSLGDVLLLANFKRVLREYKKAKEAVK